MSYMENGYVLYGISTYNYGTRDMNTCLYLAATTSAEECRNCSGFFKKSGIVSDSRCKVD